MGLLKLICSFWEGVGCRLDEGNLKYLWEHSKEENDLVYAIPYKEGQERVHLTCGASVTKHLPSLLCLYSSSILSGPREGSGCSSAWFTCTEPWREGSMSLTPMHWFSFPPPQTCSMSFHSTEIAHTTKALICYGPYIEMLVLSDVSALRTLPRMD